LATIWVLLLIAGLSPPTFAQDLPGPSVQATKAAPAPTPTLPSGFVAQTQGVPITDEHYRLGTGDKLKVNIYGEEDLSGEFLVDGSGQVQLPLVGQVKAASLTIHEFVAEVTNALK
jgi:polysaccharide export outer membrane protein